MYDSYLQHDVPQNNIVQRFFSQRWSAIVIEILMTIVITVAAGRAFDIFDPFDSSTKEPDAAQVVGVFPPAAETANHDISLRTVELAAADYSSQRQYAKAEAMYDLLIGAEPNNARYYYGRAIANNRAGDFVEAYRDRSKVLELEPWRHSAHVALCWYAGELGDYELALQHCNTFLDMRHGDWARMEALENRCWVYVEMGEYAPALADCNQVLSIDHSCSSKWCALAHYNLGRIMRAQDNIESALRHFDTAYRAGIAVRLEYVDLYLEIAQFYDTLGECWKASLNYERYLELVGKNADLVAQSRLSACQGVD